MQANGREERLLKPEEVAEKLAVSPVTIRYWLREGRIKGIKLHGLWRVKQSDLDKIMEGSE